MNIFFLSFDTKKCAIMHNDKHLVKMIIEMAQLLSTAQHLSNGKANKEIIYKASYNNHPCAIWVRQCKENYLWTLQLLEELLNEYEFRYMKEHKTKRLLKELSLIPELNTLDQKTPPPLIVSDDCKTIDNFFILKTIKSYRKYYLDYKRHLAKWTKRQPPAWWV
jgi:hypothetical protein